jgi:hypothetical protein
MTARWEYQVVEEPNPVALQERLMRAGRDGWEATSLGYAGECRLLALVRRPLVISDTAPSASGNPEASESEAMCR